MAAARADMKGMDATCVDALIRLKQSGLSTEGCGLRIEIRRAAISKMQQRLFEQMEDS